MRSISSRHPVCPVVRKRPRGGDTKGSKEDKGCKEGRKGEKDYNKKVAVCKPDIPYGVKVKSKYGVLMCEASP